MEKEVSQDKEVERDEKGRLLPGHSKPGPGRPKLTEEQKLIKKAAKEKIVEFLEEEGLGAAGRIVEMSKKAKTEKVKLSANQDVLDRLGLGGKGGNVVVPVQINFSSDREEFE